MSDGITDRGPYEWSSPEDKPEETIDEEIARIKSDIAYLTRTNDEAYGKWQRELAMLRETKRKLLVAELSKALGRRVDTDSEFTIGLETVRLVDGWSQTGELLVVKKDENGRWG